ncbi:MAG: hypothetical protein GT589_05900 [Peptoclostridium sp.]|uniref:DNA-directed RNA polymerase subunit alpha C-terminal domain-containing protein n=1 Tax=Peptoclostridium sp. TaxID=1904860 RepID=UPI00139D92F4|nr:DNA-directed RNA polymerase subunit alpha C-terminal domain-containing protein [Peptoclostridium sp.]MZQ75680.1 hypothetical protein [Peptoclostridium sp.]
MSGKELTPIEELKFSLRAYNCLRRGNIRYVEELAKKTEEELLLIRGLGQNTLEEIMSVLGRNKEYDSKMYKTWEALKILNQNPKKVFRNSVGGYMTLRRSDKDKNRFELFDPVANSGVDISHMYFDQRQYQWEEIDTPPLGKQV